MNRYLGIFVCFLVGCGGSTSSESTISTDPVENAPAERTPFVVELGSIEAAIAGEHRTEQAARDAHRHPQETLEFFGLEPGMTVVEVWPGGGWYTQILAPVLRENGRLINANVDPADEGAGQYARRFTDEFLPTAPELYDGIETVVFFPSDFMTAVPDGSVDMVLTFRSIHNWIRRGPGAEGYFTAIARVLRPGGVLGVVQHRAAEGLENGASGELGYVPQDLVVQLATAAGLVLDASSEINANPNDTTDHPGGVWALPPGLTHGDENRDAYMAIGESDRMTLRFVKPDPAAAAADAPAEE